MPHRIPRPPNRLAWLGLTALALACPEQTLAAAQPQFARPPTQHSPGADRGDKNVVLSADNVTKDDVNNTISANGHVEVVQGATMLLAEHVIWNQSTDIVTATGNVQMVDDQGNISFGDYLEITDDMRQAFIRNVSSLMSDNSRMVGRQGEKDGNVMTINRGIYSPCELCKDDPTQPPTWQIKAVTIIHDSDSKRLYYHDATFEVEGVPIAWTPYFSTYDPTVKRADGILEVLPGYRSQLGTYLKSSYYFDIAPDMDAVLEAAYYAEQGPSIGGEFRERFDTGQLQFSGSVAESDIRQNQQLPQFQDVKTVRYHVFGSGEFDLDDHWRAGFEVARSLDDIYVLKYEYSSLQVLPSHLYTEGFYDRDYINASFYSFQDLRANPVIGSLQPQQPTALPYVTYSFYGDPGETLGGRWADSGSILDIQRFAGADTARLVPAQGVERLTNNISWSRKLISDIGLVTELNASAETDYYWTQNAAPDPITNETTAQRAAGRLFPQVSAEVSYPFQRPVGYANWVVEPIMSVVGAPAYANNTSIPNEDSNDIQLDAANLFSGNRFPGVDRIEDGSRVTYGVRTGLYNLGTGYTSLFLGQSYRVSGNTVYPPDSGLTTRFSDFVGELEVVPGKLVDIDYRFELANDLKSDRLQEVNFRVGPNDFGVFGTYLFAQQVSIPNEVTISGIPSSLIVDGVPLNPNLAAAERNELTMAAYYKFDKNWSITAGGTGEITHPRAVLRYNISAGYSDDCSSFTLNLSHDQTLLVGGTSGTAVSLTFSLKNLGIFATPSIH